MLQCHNAFSYRYNDHAGMLCDVRMGHTNATQSLNSQTRSLASLLIHHPFRPTKAPHCQSDLEIHRHCNIAHPQIICIIVVLKVLKLYTLLGIMTVGLLTPGGNVVSEIDGEFAQNPLHFAGHYIINFNYNHPTRDYYWLLYLRLGKKWFRKNIVLFIPVPRFLQLY